MRFKHFVLGLVAFAHWPTTNGSSGRQPQLRLYPNYLHGIGRLSRELDGYI